MCVSRRVRSAALSGVVTGLLAAAIAILACVAPASAAPTTSSYVVVLKDEVAHPAYLAHRHEENRGAEITHTYGVALKGYSADLTAGQLKAIKKDPNVDYVESDGVIEPYGQVVGNQLKRVYANLSQLHIDENDVPADRVNADIAILDTGVYAHPDLNVVSRVVCVGGGGGCKPGQPDDDTAGHGTHVAGDAAAIDNGIGTVGTAPGARIWSVKVVNKMGHIGYDEIGMSLGGAVGQNTNLQDGNSQMSDAIAGINYVTAHSSEIEVANMSFACATDEWGCARTALAEAIATAVDKGVVWVAAAGQEGLGVASNYANIRHYPALLSDVITVSAMADYDGLPGSLSNANACPHEKGEHDDRLMEDAIGTGEGDDFAPLGSNYGPEVDITAPGSCVFSTWSPNVYFNSYDIPYKSEYGFMNGSSVASALVAGAAADLTAQFNPNNRADVESIRKGLLSAGNYNWQDLAPEGDGGAYVSPDGVKEPLLDMRFTQPTVTTTPNPAVGYTTATLDGWFNPNGADTRYYFQYGTTASYGTTIPAMPGSGIYSGTAPVHVDQPVSGLAAGTTYHYRLVAWSAGGTTYGQDQAFTTLIPAPEVSTGGVEAINSQGSTLLGAVNPRGFDSRYQFQYGATTSYGSVTTEGKAGAGASPVPATATIDDLAQNTTYHYRLVAWNAGGYSYGPDRTFTTQVYQPTSTWATRLPSTDPKGWQWVFYRGAGGQLFERYYNGTEWLTKEVPGKVASGSTPTVVRLPTDNPNDNIWVFYRSSTTGNLASTYYTGTAWSVKDLGTQMAAGTSPAVVRSPSTDPSDRIWVFTNGANGRLTETYYAGGGWANLDLGSQMAPGTSPSVVRAPTTDPNGFMAVFTQGENGRLSETYYAGTGWANLDLGSQMAPGTSPSAVRAPTTSSNGFMAVYTQGSNNRLTETYYAGTGWANLDLGTQMEPGTSPSAVRAPVTDSNAYMAVFTHGPKAPNGENGRLGETYYAGAGWASLELGVQMAAGTSPAALRVNRRSSNGYLWTYANGANGRLTEAYYLGGGWASLDLGVTMAWF